MHDWSKVCFHGGGQADFVCFHWYVSYAWPKHCYPITAMTNPNSGITPGHVAHDLWGFVKGTFHNHALRACTLTGGAASGTTGIILKAVQGTTAAAGGPVGLLATAAGGCVGGVMRYYFH